MPVVSLEGATDAFTTAGNRLKAISAQAVEKIGEVVGHSARHIRDEWRADVAQSSWGPRHWKDNAGGDHYSAPLAARASRVIVDDKATEDQQAFPHLFGANGNTHNLSRVVGNTAGGHGQAGLLHMATVGASGHTGGHRAGPEIHAANEWDYFIAGIEKTIENINQW